MVEINRLPIFTQEVFYFTLPNFEEWQKHINQIVLVEENKNIHKHNTSPEEACNVMAKRTAWNSHERYGSLNLLCAELDKYLFSFVKQEGYDIPKLEVNDCWINWYTKDNFSRPHKHGSNLSVVVFVDVEDTDAKFFFHSNENMVLVKKDETSTNFTNIKEVNVKNGTVVFFDGSLTHSVSPNTTNKKRITVAVNYSVVYPTLRENY
jgi:uncharacterized protein (TIGR02466 family)|tara:strand:- start:799 stop:1419 length:621 start_codon:yes stop_codon:yes gene_type:complete